MSVQGSPGGAGDLAAAEAHLRAGNLDEAERGFAATVGGAGLAARAQVGLARIALARDDVEAAARAVDAALASDPDHGEAHTLRGLLLELGDDLPGALAELARGADLAPGSFLAQLDLGLARLEAGDATRATAPLERAAAIDPRSVDARVGLAEARRQAGDPAGALAALAAAHALAPDRPPLALELASRRAEAGDPAGALAAVDATLAAAGEDAPLLGMAFALALEAGDAPAAARYAERAAAAEPDDEVARARELGAWLAAGDLARAEYVGSLLVALEPETAEGHLQLANLHRATGRIEGAAAEYAAAAALDPDRWTALCGLGEALIDLGGDEDLGGAVAALESAIDLAPPAHARPRYALALAQARLGRRADARAILRDVLAITPPREAAHAAAAELERDLAREFSLELIEVSASSAGKPGALHIDPALEDLRAPLTATADRYFTHLGSHARRLGNLERAAFALRGAPGIELRAAASPRPDGRIALAVSFRDRGGDEVGSAALEVPPGGVAMAVRPLAGSYARLLLLFRVRPL